MRRKIRSRKKTKKRQRLLIILAVSLLFLVCLVVDCWKKGLLPSGLKKQVEQEESEIGYGKEAVTKKSRDDKKIRVLLTNTGQTSIFHEEVTVGGTKAFTVEDEGKKKTYQAGKTITFQKKDVKAAGDGIILSCSGGRIEVSSISRRQKTPSYRGMLKLVWNSQGILLVNELSLRQYLYGVVPSEMSSEYPMEALKAQAVCARSFAWQQMKSGSYQKYDADVDDTTSFQVYNMAGEDSRTRRAVNKTNGEMLFNGDNVITAYYYSTSWGCSATAEEVWGGGANASCYPRKLQITEESQKVTKLTKLDLSDEKIFSTFIKKNICETYDSDSSWYRWTVEVTAKELGTRLGIGVVEQIQVEKRGKSGILHKVRLIGTGGRKTIEGQQDIREKLIAGSLIEKQDGSKVELSMLPSAAFAIQAEASEEGACFLFTGGGFGHGVGMSQNGAAGMAKAGMGYGEILMHYYKDCEIR